MGKFIMKNTSDNGFRFDLKAGNGETILSSEVYTTKAACENGINSVKSNSPEDSRYERKESSNGKLHFNLKATNGQVIGSSEMYNSKAAMENGIESVKKNGPDSNVVDETV
jgi:uncharacterized protein YegP (UPF0339 family)